MLATGVLLDIKSCSYTFNGTYVNWMTDYLSRNYTTPTSILLFRFLQPHG